jgi:hypothetical protein
MGRLRVSSLPRAREERGSERRDEGRRSASLVALAILGERSSRKSEGVDFCRAVAFHAPVGQGLGGPESDGIGIVVFGPAGEVQNEIPAPSFGQRFERSPVERQSHFVARRHDDEAVGGALEKDTNVTITGVRARGRIPVEKRKSASHPPPEP